MTADMIFVWCVHNAVAWLIRCGAKEKERYISVSCYFFTVEIHRMQRVLFYNYISEQICLSIKSAARSCSGCTVHSRAYIGTWREGTLYLGHVRPY